MAKLLALVGEQGTGKSSSFKTLDPKQTYIINVKNQPLPWRGSESMYSSENKNTANIDVWDKIREALIGVATNRPEVKTIIIDDMGFVMSAEYFKRASEAGYNKFAEMGNHVFSIIDTAKKLRPDLHIVFTFHPEIETDAIGETRKKIKTIGKLLDDKYTLEASFTTVLYTQVTFDKDGSPQYQFVTNRTVSCPAKSPEGMFDSLTIDNDLKQILTKVEEYYK